MAFYIHQDNEGLWWWSLATGAGWIVAVAPESYISRTDCLLAVNLVKGAGQAVVHDGRAVKRLAPDPRRAA